MLRHTFVHVPGIGPKKERDLWSRGFVDWDEFARAHPAGPWRDLILERLDPDRAAADLPAREAWRLAAEYAGATLFLDIETTGLALDGDTVTCVGVSDGTTARAFVRGVDLDRFPDALGGVKLLVTYNGASFDLPVLARAFPRVDFSRFHHVDLRFPLRRLGLKGGLKGVERALGIARPDELQGVDGFFAVRLWQAHRAGREGALETLVSYCLEDVVNLEPLLAHVYRGLAAALPVEAPPLPGRLRPAIPYRADARLVHEMLWDARPA
ncbi:MAG TPA: ribonuclease H-like domain-containing protein [Candidatus Bathyarchaeia archaeon]|nr:ribonuclease H-like domain-containing protein [Candidatus Bathyarchaeia archaeon]